MTEIIDIKETYNTETRTDRSRATSILLGRTAGKLWDMGVANSWVVIPGHDTHMFLEFGDGSKAPDTIASQVGLASQDRILHIQAYPGMSDSDGVALIARFMKKDAFKKIRSERSASVGNEHNAVVGSVYINRQFETVDWNSDAVQDIVLQALSENAASQAIEGGQQPAISS